MIRIRRYTKQDKKLWNAFLKQAKNSLFLFDRDYMDYHQDRFYDHSLLFFENNALLALLPANEKNGVLYSHQGLTFGGVISGFRMTTPRMLEVFRLLLTYSKTRKIGSIIYKAIPFIYHQLPAQEDLYALYRSGARLIGRDIASVVDMRHQLSYASGIKDSLRKAHLAKLTIKENQEYDVFMDILATLVAKKFHSTPTHTVPEIKLLASRFPANIRLFMAYDQDTALGGTIIYENPSVAQTQYIAATEKGKRYGAISMVIDHCLSLVYKKKPYFSLGKSTEKSGAYLNEGLILNKEHYGARGVVHDIYEIPV